MIMIDDIDTENSHRLRWKLKTKRGEITSPILIVDYNESRDIEGTSKIQRISLDTIIKTHDDFHIDCFSVYIRK